MADLVSYALTTVADVKEILGITGNAQDNLIKRRINLATHYIESWAGLAEGHHFKETTYTDEYFDGSGNDQLVLNMRPVTSVASFQYRDTSENGGSFNNVESELYFLSGNAGTLDGLFTQNTNWQSYKVTYTAGYDPIPADLAEAAATLAAFWVNNSTSGTNVKRKREGQREVEYFNAFGEGSNDSFISSLGLDDLLHRYKQYAI